MDKLAVLVADVGSSKNFGWAGQWGKEAESGRSIKGLAERLLDLHKNNWCVCLGFECPLFIPCPEDEAVLVKQREGEKGKPWCAAAGANSGMLGVQQLCWLLDNLKSNTNHKVQVTLNWSEFETGPHLLYLWEAFVSGAAKSDSHVGDAQKAVRLFVDALPRPDAGRAVTCSRPISFAGLALLWSGFSDDINVIHSLPLVLKATAKGS